MSKIVNIIYSYLKVIQNSYCIKAYLDLWMRDDVWVSSGIKLSMSSLSTLKICSRVALPTRTLRKFTCQSLTFLSLDYLFHS